MRINAGALLTVIALPLALIFAFGSSSSSSLGNLFGAMPETEAEADQRRLRNLRIAFPLLAELSPSARAEAAAFAEWDRSARPRPSSALHTAIAGWLNRYNSAWLKAAKPLRAIPTPVIVNDALGDP